MMLPTAVDGRTPQRLSILNDTTSPPIRASWNRQMAHGSTLWDTLVHRYDRGVRDVGSMQRQWDTLRPYVDAERWEHTSSFLAVQAREAQWWRDASIAYCRSINHLPLPAGAAEPAQSLEWYEAQHFPFAPGN